MIDIKMFARRRATGGTTAGSAGPAYQPDDSVRRALTADKATFAEQADTALKAGEAARARYADRARDLAEDSPAYDAFLRKDKEDTAKELITFLKGLIIGDGHGINAAGEAILKAITSGNFNSAEQSGFGITQRADGKYQLSITDLIVWGKAIFNELELRRLSYVGGNFVFSSCGSKIKKIEDKGNVWRCYFYQDDGSTATTNLWEVDDQARCQTFNIKAGVYQGVTNRNYWRRVMAKGEDYIDLSKTDCEQGSDAPMVDDTLVQFGNRTDTRRQAIIEIRTVGEGVPAIIMYYGVNSYTLEGKITSIQSPGDVAMAADRFRLISRSGVKVPLVSNRGTWATGEKYGYYDQVSHDGRLWLCVAPVGTVVTSQPSTTNPQWQLQVDKGSDGTSAITMSISTDNGAIFKGGIEQTRLTARIFKGETDITDTIPANKLSWVRTSNNATADTAFNNSNQGVGKSILVRRADVLNWAVKFECIYND